MTKSVVTNTALEYSFRADYRIRKPAVTFNITAGLLLYSCFNLAPIGCNLHFDSVIQCFKMLFAAVDLQLFAGTQIHKAVPAFGFQDEVKVFVFLHHLWTELLVITLNQI